MADLAESSRFFGQRAHDFYQKKGVAFCFSLNQGQDLRLSTRLTQHGQVIGELGAKHGEFVAHVAGLLPRIAIVDTETDSLETLAPVPDLYGEVDVTCDGKTLVAVHALLVAVQGGHQGALMAPTDLGTYRVRVLDALGSAGAEETRRLTVGVHLIEAPPAGLVALERVGD